MEEACTQHMSRNPGKLSCLQKISDNTCTNLKSLIIWGVNQASTSDYIPVMFICGYSNIIDTLSTALHRDTFMSDVLSWKLLGRYAQ